MEVPVTICLNCGAENNRAMALVEEHKPTPGDVSICAGCGALGIFGEDKRIKLPTISDLLQMIMDQDAILTLIQIEGKMRRDGRIRSTRNE